MRERRGPSSRKLIRAIVALVAFGVAGMVATPFALSSLSGSSAATATVVAVKATEFKFTFSKTSVPLGTVTFKVTNKGKIAHNFKIGGKKTPTLAPGKSATLTVKFTKKARYQYVCTLPGHAAAGMKGFFAVGVKPGGSTTTTVVTTTTTATTTTATVPANAVRIQVLMDEFSFKLSQSSVPVGTTVAFTAVNQGRVDHNFGMPSLGVVTPNVPPGGQAVLVVTFNTPGSIYYVCNLPQHAEAGMSGNFTVTG